MRFDDLALEVLVEKIRAAHRPESERIVHELLAHAVEAPRKKHEFCDIARLERGGIGRLAHQQWLDETALAHNVARIAVISLCVTGRMARDLASKGVVIVVER